ncbi:hypothetical protein [Pyxidicoccus trucidator]|uniref:hypothetical protein n=1 Tax=Pyxidicoccus trucidator TaxID=2709662 RepID=UPI0013DD1323|nr:hypothetical protein [Pyxidicoccus trucidator]
MNIHFPKSAAPAAPQVKPAPPPPPPPPPPVQAAPKVSRSGKTEFLSKAQVASQDQALRTIGVPTSTPQGAATTLRNERLGDGNSNCLERAMALAQPGASVVFLTDSRDGVGHAVVRNPDGSIVDPNDPKRTFPDLLAYQSSHPQYGQPLSVPREKLATVLGTPPGPGRDALIQSLGLGPVANRLVADAPDAEALISRMLELRTQNGLLPLSESELADIRRLNGNELRMYEFAVGQLGQVAAGTLSPADYMFSIMDEAARIAGDDTGLFRHLVTFSFASEPPGPFSGENLAGRHGHRAGSSLEETLYALCGTLQNADEGFNSSVIDSNFPHASTVTHHFSAFIELAQGLAGGNGVQHAHGSLGDANTNLGDVRNGNFGGMVGDAMRWNKMTPSDLATLVRWAYSATPDAPAPWGTPSTDAQGNVVPFGEDASHFELEKWVALYNEAHPGEPIAKR